MRATGHFADGIGTRNDDTNATPPQCFTKSRKTAYRPTVGGPGLRAETARGEAYDAPTDAVLFRLLDELGPGNQYLIVDRTDATDRQHYMQVYREDDGTFAIEYRDGAPERHFETLTEDVGQVRDALSGWAAGATGWRDTLPWRHWPGTGAT